MTPQSEAACKVCRAAGRFAYSVNLVGLQPDRLDIYRCGSCGLLFVGTTITDEFLERIYDAPPAQAGYYSEVESTTNEKAGQGVDDIRRLVSGHASRDRAELSLLDVGCGHGHFLQILRDRMPDIRASGYEISEASADACRARGFTTHTGALTAVEDRYDVVVLLDVAEHVRDPDQLFAECAAVMAEGGILYIHTPCFCFWDRLFLALRSVPGLRNIIRGWLNGRVSAYHLQLWTPEAMKIALQRAGFEITGFERRLELSWPLQRYGRIYLVEQRRIPKPIASVVMFFADILLVRMRLLRNKAVVTARALEQAPFPERGDNVG